MPPQRPNDVLKAEDTELVRKITARAKENHSGSKFSKDEVAELLEDLSQQMDAQFVHPVERAIKGLTMNEYRLHKIKGMLLDLSKTLRHRLVVEPHMNTDYFDEEDMTIARLAVDKLNRSNWLRMNSVAAGNLQELGLDGRWALYWLLHYSMVFEKDEHAPQFQNVFTADLMGSRFPFQLRAIISKTLPPQALHCIASTATAELSSADTQASILGSHLDSLSHQIRAGCIVPLWTLGLRDWKGMDPGSKFKYCDEAFNIRLQLYLNYASLTNAFHELVHRRYTISSEDRRSARLEFNYELQRVAWCACNHLMTEVENEIASMDDQVSTAERRPHGDAAEFDFGTQPAPFTEDKTKLKRIQWMAANAFVQYERKLFDLLAMLCQLSEAQKPSWPRLGSSASLSRVVETRELLGMTSRAVQDFAKARRLVLKPAECKDLGDFKRWLEVNVTVEMRAMSGVIEEDGDVPEREESDYDGVDVPDSPSHISYFGHD